MDKHLVVTLPQSLEFAQSPEGIKNTKLAELIAKLQGSTFAGPFSESLLNQNNKLYFVPDKPIVGFDYSNHLGIHGKDDLFGGVVPFDFVRTKAIVHPLVSPEAAHPEGWKREFPEMVKEVVIPGFTAFRLEDALQAAELLFQKYSVLRLKRPASAGSNGQYTLFEKKTVKEIMSEIPEREIRKDGVVLEVNLENAITLSVGMVYVAGITVSYFGSQRETKDGLGETVYAGSDLTIVRGTFEDLLSYSLPDDIRKAVLQTLKFHHASHIYNIIASRNNYDIGQGVDRQNTKHLGVFEQSWRIGGASGAEILAVEVFKNEPDIDVVKASTHNEFGVNADPPPEAVVHFEGAYQNIGPIATYSVIEQKLKKKDFR